MRGISALFAVRLLPVSGRLGDLLNVEFILHWHVVLDGVRLHAGRFIRPS